MPAEQCFTKESRYLFGVCVSRLTQLVSDLGQSVQHQVPQQLNGDVMRSRYRWRQALVVVHGRNVPLVTRLRTITRASTKTRAATLPHFPQLGRMLLMRIVQSLQRRNKPSGHRPKKLESCPPSPTPSALVYSSRILCKIFPYCNHTPLRPITSVLVLVHCSQILWEIFAYCSLLTTPNSAPTLPTLSSSTAPKSCGK